MFCSVGLIGVVGATGACTHCYRPSHGIGCFNDFHRYLDSRNWEASSPNACNDILFLVVHHYGIFGVRKHVPAHMRVTLIICYMTGWLSSIFLSYILDHGAGHFFYSWLGSLASWRRSVASDPPFIYW